jgi:hypothetical protein
LREAESVRTATMEKDEGMSMGGCRVNDQGFWVLFRHYYRRRIDS